MGVITIEKKKKPDWNRIKSEYIAGSDSLRDMSEKYKVPWSTLRQRAFREKWGAMRKAVQTKVERNVIKETQKKTVSNATLASDIKRKGLIILDALFDDFAQVRATEHRESRRGITDIKRLRDLTQAYRDLTDDMQTGENASNELLESLIRLEKGVKHD